MNQDTIYTSEELKQIQRLELECLHQMLDLCRKLEIEAFLIGGSALGAVRHGGFIPWDDDIDVGMTRVNYRRFLEQAPALLPSGYELQTPYNAKYNPYFYSKLRVDGTRFVEYSNHRNRKMHHGVYVDRCRTMRRRICANLNAPSGTSSSSPSDKPQIFHPSRKRLPCVLSRCSVEE